MHRPLSVKLNYHRIYSYYFQKFVQQTMETVSGSRHRGNIAGYGSINCEYDQGCFQIEKSRTEFSCITRIVVTYEPCKAYTSNFLLPKTELHTEI